MSESDRRPRATARAAAGTTPWGTASAGTSDDDATGAVAAAPVRPRLVGIDAARGLALIGMVSIHILPARALFAWAAVFALAGVQMQVGLLLVGLGGLLLLTRRLVLTGHRTP